ncbi:MAG: aminopeptidase [Bacilli bacterium]|nr:aminopeptidase [Bacilli bacterium]
MVEKKLKELATIIVDHSLKVKENERVLITYKTLDVNPLVKELIKKIQERKGIVFVNVLNDPEISSLLSKGNTKMRIEEIAKHMEFEANNFDSFINIKYQLNDYENKNMDEDMKKLLAEKTQKYSDIKTNKRKWVLLNYPSNVDAHKAKMKISDFYDYALDVMTIDYDKMANDVKPLKELMEKTDRVRITGKDTDLTFSIKDIPVVPCTGECNIPDGEVFTAPIKDSVNGYITYNTPSPYEGNVFHNVRLEFENGKIIKATCDEDNTGLNKIFDRDEGARYIGEFSIGINPKITDPIGDILYDEKIIGSIHFTPGRSYDEASNGNISSIHWDMVLIQREEYGGGDIYFDDELIRKDGKFVIDSLKHLNYDE